MSTLTDALIYLRPGINFADINGTLEKVRWDPPLPDDFKPPTQDEVDAALAYLANPVPASIANWKGRAILVQRGLSDKVAEVIAAIPDATQRAMVQIAFESADFTRNSPMLNSVLSAVGLDDAAKDDLFRDADKLGL